MNLEDVVDQLQGKAVSAMTRAELVELFGAIAERGADNALARVGLHDDFAVSDMKDLRDLIRGYRVIKKGALQQLGKALMWAVILAVMSLLYTSPTTKELVKHIPMVGE